MQSVTVIIILHLSDDKSIFRYKVVEQLSQIVVIIYSESSLVSKAGADTRFLERGFICIKVWGFALRILPHF